MKPRNNPFRRSNALILAGSGSLTLTNTNTFTGTTTVSGGTLIVSGTLTQPGNLVVQTGATLENQGTISSTGSLAVNAGSVFRPKIAQSTPVALNVAGTVILAGALDTSAAGLTPGATFTILNKTSAGAVNGIFSGKPQGSTFTASGYLWSISYTGGDGNDVILRLATRQESWRYANFGTTDNSGAAADTFDADGDGELNLMEFATGQNPNAATSATPTLVINGATIEFTYTRAHAALAELVTFIVEWTDTLADDWDAVGVSAPVVLTDNGTVEQVKVTLPVGTAGRRLVYL